MHTVHGQLTLTEQLKSFIRWICAVVLFYSGINYLYQVFNGKRHLVVLMYHRVVDEIETSNSYIQPGMYVKKSVFEMQMKYISSNYHVLPLPEVLNHFKQNIRFRKKTCLITFDDGWRDNYRHAFPILEKYKIPATIFLPTQYITSGHWLWPEIVGHLTVLFLNSHILQEIDILLYPYLENLGFFRIISRYAENSEKIIDSLVSILKNKSDIDRDNIINELKRICNKQFANYGEERLLMDWDEVRELNAKNISFGSHTENHRILTGESYQTIASELEGSKKEIEQQVSNRCTAFAYPNGNYNTMIKELVQRHYECAFTTNFGLVSSADDIYLLNRVGIHNDIAYTKPLFACRISGLLSRIGM